MVRSDVFFQSPASHQSLRLNGSRVALRAVSRSPARSKYAGRRWRCWAITSRAVRMRDSCTAANKRANQLLRLARRATAEGDRWRLRVDIGVAPFDRGGAARDESPRPPD